jgi:hypothetical protein
MFALLTPANSLDFFLAPFFGLVTGFFQAFAQMP